MSGPPAEAARPGPRTDGRGVAFRVYSGHAERIELCLFDDDGGETARHDLTRADDGWWSVHVPDLGPGALYGYRAHGRWSPADGLWFNPAKLLMDPEALAITGEPRHDEAHRAAAPADSLDAATPDPRDNAASMPRSIVVDPGFDWRDDAPPRIAWSDTVIYECHVRGTTRRHPEVDEELRGTYLGLASEPVIDHLRRLGVTAVELLPVHQIASEPHLGRLGLANYFGYSPLGFLAPHAGYATGNRGEQVGEFKRMVRRFHAAGIEVLIDVVLNHTAEGPADGPTLCLRGIDNPSYYRLDGDGRYVDFTGTGNTLDLRQPAALELVERTLLYWVEEMRVDGFRFDLAPVLGRVDGFDPEGPFFERLRAHPSLAGVKLIAEPWDLGPRGYRLGEFPVGWREWNDRFRDAARGFWRGDRVAADLGEALAGSPRTFPRPRGPLASVDFVTCHDGFTLADLVSYDRKHNLANGEDNRDGRDINLSSNWGVEGPSDDPEIRASRRRARRNLFATLALARGVPMISHGDELGRSQSGNNNAYCHDSELTWLDWELDDERADFLSFCRAALELRGRLALDEEPIPLGPDGRRLTELSNRGVPLLGLWRPESGLLLLLNGSDRERRFDLPAVGAEWRVLLCTARPDPDPIEDTSVTLRAHSLVVAERLRTAV